MQFCVPQYISVMLLCGLHSCRAHFTPTPPAMTAHSHMNPCHSSSNTCTHALWCAQSTRPFQHLQSAPLLAVLTGGLCLFSASWNYLTVELNRTNNDSRADPDLYGMFYGGTDGQVVLCALACRLCVLLHTQTLLCSQRCMRLIGLQPACLVTGSLYAML